MPHFLTHLYYASKKSENHKFLYGATFPDTFFFLKKRHKTALKFAKHLAEKNKKFEPFYQGVKTHINLDNKFHKKILPYKIIKFKKKFNVSSYFAHSILEIALDYNIYRNKRKKIDYLLVIFNKFNPKEIIYYLSTLFKLSENFLDSVMIHISSLAKLSTKFTISSFIKRGKIFKLYFQKEFKKNLSIIKDLPKLIKTWKYAIELTKNYDEYL